MKKVWEFKLTIIVTLLILVAILMPGDAVPSVGIPGMDKIVHFGMFFTLTGIFNFEYFISYKRVPKWGYVLAGIGIFAISTEIMQLFAASRAFDLKDFAVDMIGCLASVGLWRGWEYVKKK